MNIRTAWIILNTECNNNCSICYGGFYLQNNKILDLQLLKKIIFFLSTIKCGNIVFLGGEPSLYPFLIQALELTSEYGIKCSIVTNGRNFSDIFFLNKFNKFKNSTSFTISIYGTKEIHDRITRVPGSYSEAINGLKNCIEFGYNVTSNTTILNLNYNNLNNLFNDLLKTGLSNFLMNYGIPPFNNFYNSDNFLDLDKVNLVLENIKDILSKEKIFITIATPLPLCIFNNTLNYIPLDKIKISTTCNVLTGGGITIDYNGNILPCSHFVDIKLGNINEFKNLKEFELFWNVILEKRYRQKLRKFPSRICNKCNLNNNCSGGCPIIWLYTDSNTLEGGFKC